MISVKGFQANIPSNVRNPVWRKFTVRCNRERPGARNNECGWSGEAKGGRKEVGLNDGCHAKEFSL